MNLPPRLLTLALSLLTLALTGCGPAEKTTVASTAAPASAAPGAPAAPAAAPAPATEAELAAGKAVYQRVCIVCHMADGKGVPAAFPPLNGSEVIAGDPDRLIRIVLHGLQGPIEVAGKTFNSVMPPQGPILKDHEIAKVLTYVRHTWGNGASPVSDQAVTTVRKNVQRPTPWTWAELNQK
ncbi:Cytochrome c-552 precursor [Lacunisphaera limnophila]|uniref:Cytochrome c-552 n=1 Tax=Lacunisphaera limnophila TaxID=1838286 RepID=A0A1D8ARJ7_9BACT|nr:cytochrome c [Lacunisphaera limnophila]AOS43513.1 Cytochrome c-552 precursor [Lacunisphaera limnophila]